MVRVQYSHECVMVRVCVLLNAHDGPCFWKEFVLIMDVAQQLLMLL
jgi:hypothetical protein